MKKTIGLIFTFIFFSFSANSENLVPLEQILAEDNPKNLPYVLLRCSGLHLSLSYLPRDNLFSSEEERFLSHSTMSVTLFDTVAESHAYNTNITLKESRKFIAQNLFEIVDLYLNQMDASLKNSLEKTSLKNDNDACFEIVMTMGIDSSKYFKYLQN